MTTPGDAGGSVARIDGENGTFNRSEPRRRETGPSPHSGNTADQNRLKPCGGKPFDLETKLELESQKGNPG
jgi:hypothetical protein